MIDKEVFKLAVTTIFDCHTIDQIFTKCRTMYYPKEKALDKCKTILDTAAEFAISPMEAYYIQIEIDFVLL